MQLNQLIMPKPTVDAFGNPIHYDVDDISLYTERLYNHIRELEKRVEKCERDIDLILLSDKQ